MKSFQPVTDRISANPSALAVKGLCVIFLCTTSAFISAAQSQPSLIRHYDNVLGTSLDIAIYGDSLSGQEQAVDNALVEVERLEQILSSWRADSELETLNLNRISTTASTDLIAVVEACETWLETSNGAFSCRMGKVFDLWNAAEKNQQRPIVPDMLPAARAAQRNSIVIEPDEARIELGEEIDLEPSGLAKGYIIDQIMSLLQQDLPGAIAIKVDIGGDASYWGEPTGEGGWLVNVANPEDVTDNSNFITSLNLNSMAIASSGHRTRTWNIDDQLYSQILDSRRGWPVADGLHAVVIAPDAVTADAIATTLSTQYIGPALIFVNSMEYVEALLIESNGTIHLSDHWQDYLGGELQRQANATIELTVNYFIPNLRARDYERPYLAIWVSDADNRPIKNLLLLGTDSQWARTNAVWWRRVGRRKELPATNVTRPTREPGNYQLSWNGQDDNGNNMLEGDYQLMIEASREHGNHDYMSIPFKLEEGARNFEQVGQGELGDVSMTINLTPPG